MNNVSFRLKSLLLHFQDQEKVLGESAAEELALVTGLLRVVADLDNSIVLPDAPSPFPRIQSLMLALVDKYANPSMFIRL